DEDRDLHSFAKAQSMISSGADVPQDVQRAWLSNGINSRAMTVWLARNASGLDRVITGPYLFGLTCAAAAVVPDKTLLLPCLHDEAFAYLSCFREMFSSVRGCIFNSEPERDLAVSLHSLPAERLFVVGMGLDPFESDPAAFGRSRGIPAPYIFYAGRREPLKGTPLLVDYFAAFKARTGSPLRLVLAGAGSVERPRSFADHVLDVGFLGEQEKRDAMAGALVFAHPSVNESLSIVLLESWLAGAPALVHACGRVLVHQCRRSNGGLWFRNYPEFEEALLLLEKNPGLRDALGKAGRGMVEKEYSWQAVDEKLGAALAC
ncbi:MAG: glycosyltransferase family 4 protein, partial [Lentisphaerae bacterium]|nr:glycosyltransferase family 4 protein [Lentisphaerota bacterium]